MMNVTKTCAFLLVLVALGLFVFSGPASAVLIENTTTTTTLFFDDFEGLGTSVSHAAPPDSSGDYDPNNGGYPGSWNTITEAASTGIQVTDYGAPGPAPNDGGNNYGRIHWDGSTLGAGFTNQTTTNDALHFEWMQNGSSGTNFGINVWGPGADIITVTLMFGMAPINYYDGDSWESTGLTATSSAWEKWEIDFAIGATTFDLTIAGNQATGLLCRGSTAQVDRLGFQMSANSTAYIDAVPEPSSLALLALGALGLTFFRRRRPSEK